MAAQNALSAPVDPEQDNTNPIKSRIDFTNITENDEKETKDKYECITLFKSAEEAKQKALWKILTVGRKNNYPQLLLLLMSDYHRERVKHFIKTPKENSLSLKEWIKNSERLQQFISAPVNSTIHNIEQLIISAMRTFQTRLCNPINFGILSEEKINDSIVFYAMHITNAIDLIKNKYWRPPCQLDVWIIPQKIGEQTNDNNTDDHEEIKEDHEDTDDEDDDESSDEEKDSLETNIEQLNIEHHLKETIDIDSYIKHHDFMQIKKRFMEKIKWETQNKRYCMIIERNKGNKGNNGNDGDDNNTETIYMYKPLIMQNIPHDIPEWGIQASLTDILPSSKCKKYKQITGKQGLNGKMFLLSLQKYQENETRAWLIKRNAICRFYPSDIINILPHFFVQNKLTEISYKQIMSLIASHEIKDEIFDKFSNTKHNEVSKLTKTCDIEKPNDVNI